MPTLNYLTAKFLHSFIDQIPLTLHSHSLHSLNLFQHLGEASESYIKTCLDSIEAYFISVVPSYFDSIPNAIDNSSTSLIDLIQDFLFHIRHLRLFYSHKIGQYTIFVEWENNVKKCDFLQEKMRQTVTNKLNERGATPTTLSYIDELFDEKPTFFPVLS